MLSNNKILFLIFFFCSSLSYAQNDNKRAIYYYNFARTYGVVKYYGISNADRNSKLDSISMIYIERLDSCSSDASFNELMRFFLNSFPIRNYKDFNYFDGLDSLQKLNVDFSWIQTSELNVQNRSILDSIVKRFEPQGNAFTTILPRASFPSSLITFRSDSLMYNISSDSLVKNRSLKILSFVRSWNIINYFYPLKRYVVSSWDSAFLLNFNLLLKTQSGDDLIFFYYRLLKLTNNSISGSYVSRFLYKDQEFKPSINVLRLDGKIFVVNSGIDVLHRGDRILRIDGMPIEFLYDSLSNLLSVSNKSYAEKLIMDKILLGKENSMVKIEYQSAFNSKINNVEVRRTVDFYLDTTKSIRPLLPDSLRNKEYTYFDCGGKKIAYINCELLDYQKINDLFTEISLTATDLILDLRGNLGHPFSYQLLSSWFFNSLQPKTHLYIFPDSLASGTYKKISMGPSKSSNVFTGNVFVIQDANTSYLSYQLALDLKCNRQKCVFVGTATGIDNPFSVNFFKPANDITLAIEATMNYRFPELKPIIWGLDPDVFVSETYADLLVNTDTKLNKAIKLAGCDQIGLGSDIVKKQTVIFPNPSSTNQFYLNKTIDHYDLLNSMGQKLLDGIGGSEINLVGLMPGTYFLKLYSGHVTEIQKIILN